MKGKLRTYITPVISLLLICSLVLFLADGTVFASAKRPKLNVKKLNMTMGSEFKLRIYNLKKKQKVTFVSSDSSVVSIENWSASGKQASIKAQGIGSATVKAIIRKGKKVVRRLKCNIKVSPSGVSIKFLKRTVHLQSGSRISLETIIKPNTSTEQPVFESDNPEVATVSSRGVVTALAPGTANITATLLSADLSAVCTIVVEAPEEASPTPRPKPQKLNDSPLGTQGY